MDKVLFIDAMNSIHRANIGFAPKKVPPNPEVDAWTSYGSVNPNSTASERSDQYVVIFNFFRNLRPIIEQFSPDKCFFVLEGHPQFRYDLFPDYKANRLIKQAANKESRDKLHQFKDEIIRLLQYLPITITHAANYEADDTIATLCDNMKEEELTVLSGDTDYIQLLQRGYAHCQIYNPIKKIFMEAPQFPYTAHKALVGDKSDNIPRIVSDKKALKYMNDPALFQEFMNNEENRSRFAMNRSLIEFRSIPEEEIILKEGSRSFALLREEFTRMDFQSIINENSWKKYTKTFDCLKY